MDDRPVRNVTTVVVVPVIHQPRRAEINPNANTFAALYYKQIRETDLPHKDYIVSPTQENLAVNSFSVKKFDVSCIPTQEVS
jgi:hypothetical protein